MPAPKLIAGNWKMNSLAAEGVERAATLAAAVGKSNAFDMVLCPPATLIQAVVKAVQGSAIAVGAQDCHAAPSGAHTGDIAAPMLKDLGCAYVLAGHSERRQNHRETSAGVAAKAKAAHAAGLIAIICIGETDAEREAGRAEAVVLEQLQASVPEGATPENTVIAYEPVWAIGTGKVASVDDIRGIHAVIRGKVPYKILYGGSVKASNAAEIMRIPNVDGVLVGGASLKAEEFMGIATAA